MKPYFAKYLPIERPLQEGDRFLRGGTLSTVLGGPDYPTFVRKATEEDTKDWDPSVRDSWQKMAWIRNENGHEHWYFKNDMPPVQLFLCSRVIQIGDTIRHFDTVAPQPEEVVKDDVDVAYCTGMKGFKPVAELSPAAVWVKEGDEFPFEQIILQENVGGQWSPRIAMVQCPTCQMFH